MSTTYLNSYEVNSNKQYNSDMNAATYGLSGDALDAAKDEFQKFDTNNVHTPYGVPKFQENKDDGNLNFLLPQYGVQNFINERALWEKGVHNITGEPGWFYFKIFFNFDTKRGLFGNIFDSKLFTNSSDLNNMAQDTANEAMMNYAMGDYGGMMNAMSDYNDLNNQQTEEILNQFDKSTSALRYLLGIRNHYKNSLIYHRILALYKFTYLLSYINRHSPWFFSGISNINKLNAINRDEITKERYIDLICNGDSIDMRLDELLEFYKYATYDNINFREVLPENLRRFDMSIVIMNAPIKYFQTGMFTAAQALNLPQVGSNGSTLLNKALAGINKISSFISGNNIEYFDYKTINGKNNGPQDRLTFEMYTLKECEIDPVSFEGYLPNSISNQQFFRIGNGAIKIKFNRVYKHTFNEWNQTMFGDDGFYYDGNLNKYRNVMPADIYNKLSKEVYDTGAKNNNINRIQAIQKSIYNTFFNKDATAYKALIDFSESIIEDSLINASDPKLMGNIGTNYNENDLVDRFNNLGDQLKNYFKW